MEGSGLRLRAQAVLLVFIYVLTRRRGANTAHTQWEAYARGTYGSVHTQTHANTFSNTARFFMMMYLRLHAKKHILEDLLVFDKNLWIVVIVVPELVDAIVLPVSMLPVVPVLLGP